MNDTDKESEIRYTVELSRGNIKYMCKKSECTTKKKATRILCLKENYTSCVKRIKTVR